MAKEEKRCLGKKGVLFTLGSLSLLKTKFKEFAAELDEEIKDKNIEEKLDGKIGRLVEKFDTFSVEKRQKITKFFGVATRGDLEKLRDEIKKMQEKGEKK